MQVRFQVGIAVEMAQSSAMNPSGPTEKAGAQGEEVKTEAEVEILIKAEALECVVCGARSREAVDMSVARTPSGAPLHAFLAKYTQHELALAGAASKPVCHVCFDLISVLERAEMEYVKLKDAFEAIISKNPLFDVNLAAPLAPISLTAVKRELEVPPAEDSEDVPPAEDSEDEPLARRKSQSTKVKKKKRLNMSKSKRKKAAEMNSWECDECGVKGDSGGPIALTAHKLTVHADIAPVKLEEGSQSPFDNGIDESLELTFGDFDDDEDINYDPDELNGTEKKKTRRRQGEKKEPKVMHRCDQCNARYSSLARLESHKLKHDGSKPPYICEVCGAHYKHKRACDIHIAMHKGISDWKCEECNKLFPSKNALQRHNNIHTGKLNYQCDLCGKSFIHTSSFKMHKLSHTGVKPHACDVCGLGLMTRSHLKRHKRIHSGEKRHECTACGKRFSERYNLAAHVKSHEPGAAPPAPPERRTHFFRCTFCTERFERRYMLERHMSAVHGRTLERPPPTPRNTMSKLLKQRAQRPSTAQEPPTTPATKEEERSGESTPASVAAIPSSKLLAQLTSTSSIITTGSWSGAYAAEFGLRHDYPH